MTRAHSFAAAGEDSAASTIVGKCRTSSPCSDSQNLLSEDDKELCTVPNYLVLRIHKKDAICKSYIS